MSETGHTPAEIARLVGELETLKGAFAAEGDNFGMEVSEALHNAAQTIRSLFAQREKFMLAAASEFTKSCELADRALAAEAAFAAASKALPASVDIGRGELDKIVCAAVNAIYPPAIEPSPSLPILVEALEKIEKLSERPYQDFPADWREQIENCSECQRYKDHSIQQGICDQHRKPLYARESHDRHETSVLGYRAMGIARDTLRALTLSKESNHE